MDEMVECEEMRDVIVDFIDEVDEDEVDDDI